MATATRGKSKRIGAVIAERLTGFVADLKGVRKLSPDERLVLTAECENQWHWCKDRKYRTTIKGLVDMGLMRFARHPQGDNMAGWEVTGLGRAVADGLRRKRPGATLEGPKPPRSGQVGRRRSEPDTKTYLGRFAVRLNDRMKRQGISVKELADKLGVSETTVYDWLAARKEPNMDRYPALAIALGLKKPGDVLPLE